MNAQPTWELLKLYESVFVYGLISFVIMPQIGLIQVTSAISRFVSAAIVVSLHCESSHLYLYIYKYVFILIHIYLFKSVYLYIYISTYIYIDMAGCCSLVSMYCPQLRNPLLKCTKGIFSRIDWSCVYVYIHTCIYIYISPYIYICRYIHLVPSTLHPIPVCCPPYALGPSTQPGAI